MAAQSESPAVASSTVRWRTVSSVSPTPLPGADRAIIDPPKLRDYALNDEHIGVGRFKARRFRSDLGLERDDWEHLAAEIRRGVVTTYATPKGTTITGEDKYEVVIQITGKNGKQAPVTTAWKMTAEGPFLVSAYIKRRR